MAARGGMATGDRGVARKGEDGWLRRSSAWLRHRCPARERGELHSLAAREMVKDGPFVEPANKKRDAFWDAKIPKAAIDVKRIQVMLECIRHASQMDSL